MGSGGGGGRYFPTNPGELHSLISQAQESEAKKRFESEVNFLLQDCLATFNQRGVQKIQNYLDRVGEILGEDFEIDKFLFGGSVAKHTYVDGLSDIDALAILNKADLKGATPDEVLDQFCRLLKDNSPADEVKCIERGQLAVTISYRDGTEMQILPAKREGEIIHIPSATSKSWKATDPDAFRDILTTQNQRLDNKLVPAIKLAKAIIDNLPEQKKISGYHLESLAVDFSKDYNGQTALNVLLTNFFKDASDRILHPIPDPTGQSRHVDSYLGQEDSVKRKIASDAFAQISRQMESAKDLSQWRQLIGL